MHQKKLNVFFLTEDFGRKHVLDNYHLQDIDIKSLSPHNSISNLEILSRKGKVSEKTIGLQRPVKNEKFGLYYSEVGNDFQNRVLNNPIPWH